MKFKLKDFNRYDLGIIFMVVGLVLTSVFGGWGLFTAMSFICAGIILTGND